MLGAQFMPDWIPFHSHPFWIRDATSKTALTPWHTHTYQKKTHTHTCTQTKTVHKMFKFEFCTKRLIRVIKERHAWTIIIIQKPTARSYSKAQTMCDQVSEMTLNIIINWTESVKRQSETETEDELRNIRSSEMRRDEIDYLYTVVSI